jgi:hypothetical protein
MYAKSQREHLENRPYVHSSTIIIVFIQIIDNAQRNYSYYVLLVY